MKFLETWHNNSYWYTSHTKKSQGGSEQVGAKEAPQRWPPATAGAASGKSMTTDAGSSLRRGGRQAQCTQIQKYWNKFNNWSQSYCIKLVECSLEAEFDSTHDGEKDIKKKNDKKKAC